MTGEIKMLMLNVQKWDMIGVEGKKLYFRKAQEFIDAGYSMDIRTIPKVRNVSDNLVFQIFINNKEGIQVAYTVHTAFRMVTDPNVLFHNDDLPPIAVAWIGIIGKRRKEQANESATHQKQT